MELEVVVDYVCTTGEAPLWHPDEQCLYWVDIPSGRMFRYDPATESHQVVYHGEPVGGLALRADGALLLFMGQGAIKSWRHGRLEDLVAGIPGEQDARFNDVIGDPAGRVFCGTLSTPGRAGRLYRLNADTSITKVLDGIQISNGMGFSLDQRHLYHTDSGAGEISIFDYDLATGDLTNRRAFVRAPAGEYQPDGLTVDAEGYVWSACWDGACVLRYAPDGLLERRIELPARLVTSVAFGGPDYADLYITTAGGNDRGLNGPQAGALFRLRPGPCGLPEYPSRAGL